jgi:integration host factor subunit alpha
MGLATFGAEAERIPRSLAHGRSPVETRERRGSAAGKRVNGASPPDKVAALSDDEAIARTALTKEELQNLLFANIGLSKRECREMVNAIFEEMRVALESGDTVKLEGFGRFQPKERPKRWARNLKSGERIPVSERRVVTFHPSRKITDSIGPKGAPGEKPSRH